MAKKSSKSKGYRKTAKKKPYLSKRDIIITAAIVVALIAAVVLFNLFYDDGSLKSVDGVLQVEGENNLILNEGSTKAPSYYKVGQLGEMEGWTLTADPLLLNDDNVMIYTYVPDEESTVDQVMVFASNSSAQTRAATLYASIASSSDAECGDAQETEVDGHKMYYFTYTQSNPEATEENAEEAAEESAEGETEDAKEEKLVRSLCGYLESGERCIYIGIVGTGEDEAALPSEEELNATLETLLPCISYETK